MSESLQMIPNDSTLYWPQELLVHAEGNPYSHEEFHCNQSNILTQHMFQLHTCKSKVYQITRLKYSTDDDNLQHRSHLLTAG